VTTLVVSIPYPTAVVVTEPTADTTKITADSPRVFVNAPDGIRDYFINMNAELQTERTRRGLT
jgi:hypothetical protein